MRPDDFLALAGVLPEPSVLVTSTGQLVAANSAALELLKLSPGAVHHTPLRDLLDDPDGRLTKFLAACSRTRTMLPGALPLRRNGTTLHMRCQGALVRTRDGDEPAIVFLRFLPAESVNNRFVLLNRKLDELTREVRVRRVVEVERARLLAEERRLREQLEQQTIELEQQTEEAQLLVEETEQASQALADALGEAERLRAEARESERRFHEIADAAPVLIWTTDARGDCDWFNEPWLHFTGRSLAQQIGTGWAASVHEEDRPRVRETFDAAMGERSMFRAEYRLRHHTGLFRWVRDTGVPRLAPDGTLLGYVGSCIDVHEERVDADRSAFLADATRLLNASLDLDLTLESLTAHAIPFLADYCSVDLVTETGEIVRVSSSHRDSALEDVLREVWRRYPYRPDERLGVPEVVRTRTPALVPSFPDEAMAVFARDAEHLRMLRLLNPRSYICVPLVARDIAYGAISFVMSDSGRIYGTDELELAIELGHRSATAIDNARLFTAEQRARAMAERAVTRTQLLQSITSSLGRATTSSEIADIVLREGLGTTGAFDGVIGLLTADGRSVEIAGDVGYPSALIEHFRVQPIDAELPVTEVIRSGVPIFFESRHEYATRFPELVRVLSDRMGTAALAVAPLEIKERRFGALALAFREPRIFEDEDRALITSIAQQCAQAFERTRLYEAERAARALAESANRAKAEFLATMSHELRTPINATVGYVELLAMHLHGPLTAEQTADLERIRRNQNHLLGVITDILNFSRIEAGQVEYTVAEVALWDVIVQAREMIAPLASARSIRAEFVPLVEEHIVLADRAKLEQILVNLLSNAVKFSDPGGRLLVTHGADGDVVWIAVRDWGIGIPPDKHEAIFEPFVQVDSSLTRRREGTGLGLAISRDLARGMGGDITVHSAPGDGATFTLTLPRARGGARA